jgi:hypothetical protein
MAVFIIFAHIAVAIVIAVWIGRKIADEPPGFPDEINRLI